MMLRLGRQMVRHSWPLYAGAFVALGFGVVLLGGRGDGRRGRRTTGTAEGVTAEERTQLGDLASLFGIMSAVALFMAVFVVAARSRSSWPPVADSSDCCAWSGPHPGRCG